MVDNGTSRQTKRTYVELFERDRIKLASLLDVSGLSVPEFLARLVEWYLQQDPKFQKAVYTGWDEATGVLIRQAVGERLADLPPEATFDQAAAVARAGLDVMVRIRKAENERSEQADDIIADSNSSSVEPHSGAAEDPITAAPGKRARLAAKKKTKE